MSARSFWEQLDRKNQNNSNNNSQNINIYQSKRVSRKKQNFCHECGNVIMPEPKETFQLIQMVDKASSKIDIPGGEISYKERKWFQNNHKRKDSLDILLEPCLTNSQQESLYEDMEEYCINCDSNQFGSSKTDFFHENLKSFMSDYICDCTYNCYDKQFKTSYSTGTTNATNNNCSQEAWGDSRKYFPFCPVNCHLSKACKHVLFKNTPSTNASTSPLVMYSFGESNDCDKSINPSVDELKSEVIFGKNCSKNQSINSKNSQTSQSIPTCPKINLIRKHLHNRSRPIIKFNSGKCTIIFNKSSDIINSALNNLHKECLTKPNSLESDDDSDIMQKYPDEIVLGECTSMFTEYCIEYDVCKKIVVLFFIVAFFMIVSVTLE